MQKRYSEDNALSPRVLPVITSVRQYKVNIRSHSAALSLTYLYVSGVRQMHRQKTVILLREAVKKY